jgi:hypothetical protein
MDREMYICLMLLKKNPNAKYKRGWQYIFPAKTILTDPKPGIQRRHHLYDTFIQKLLNKQLEMRNLLNRQVVILSDILLQPIC